MTVNANAANPHNRSIEVEVLKKLLENNSEGAFKALEDQYPDKKHLANRAVQLVRRLDILDILRTTYPNKRYYTWGRLRSA